jgi:hypothetical protein
LFLDDLVSYGVLGLMDGIEKFNPEQGVKFQTYAKLLKRVFDFEVERCECGCRLKFKRAL